MKRKAGTLRLIGASFAGSLFSLLIFIDISGFVFLLIVRIITSLLITVIAFPFINRKEFIKTALAIIGVGTIYSGFFVLIYQLFKPPNMIIINDILYFEFNPLIMLGCTALIYLVITLFGKLFRERMKSTVVSLEFVVDQQAYSCPAKIDTGCNLTEPFSAAPVIIVDSAVFQIGDRSAKRVIPYSTVGGSSLLYAVKAEGVRIDHSEIDKEIYIASTRISNVHFQAIINSEIVR